MIPKHARDTTVDSPTWVADLSTLFSFHVPSRPVLNGNTTQSFLITTDTDIGDLMIVKLRWEKDAIISWSDWWGSSKFHIRKLRIKSGETQSKYVYLIQKLHITHFMKLKKTKFWFPGWSSVLRMENLPTWSGEVTMQCLLSQKKTTWAVKRNCK